MFVVFVMGKVVNGLDQEQGRVFIKQGYEIYTLQGRQDLDSILLGLDGPVVSLEAANRPVRVHTHGESVSQGPCLPQVLDVALVQDIKAAVRKHTFPVLPFQIRDLTGELFPGADLRIHEEPGGGNGVYPFGTFSPSSKISSDEVASPCESGARVPLS